MNGFTEEHKAMVEQIAWKIGDAVAERLQKNFSAEIKLHQAECAHGKKINKIVLLSVGIAIGLGAAGGGIGVALTRLLIR